MALDQSAMRADTSNIIDDWTETISFLRATHASITGYGGEFTQTYSTNLTTGCDVQPMNPRSRPLITLAGQQFQPDVMVILRHGSDVVSGDRFTFAGDLHYIQHVRPDEDKVIAWASAKALDNAG